MRPAATAAARCCCSRAILLAPGIWAAGVVAKETNITDPQIVVVDEVIGQWITLAGAATFNWKTWLAAFVLFRLLDIWKPAPARQLESLPGGWGIVADDVMAGLYGALAIFVLDRLHLYCSYSMASKKDSNGRPQISTVTPEAAIPGGEFQIRGAGLAKSERPRVTIGDMEAPIVIGSDSCVIVRVPEGASAGELVVANGALEQPGLDLRHRNPDRRESVSGRQPGGGFLRQHLRDLQRIARAEDAGVGLQDRSELQLEAVRERDHERHRAGVRQSRHAVHFQPLRRHRLSGHLRRQRVGRTWKAWAWPPASRSIRTKTCTSATAAARFSRSAARARFTFSPRWSLPSPRIISRSERTAICTSPDPPRRASIRCIAFRRHGEVETYYRGLGRPQGLAFDAEGRLYVAASLGGRRGVVRFDHDRNPELFLSGPGIVGLAFTPSRALVVCTNNALYRVDVGIAGRPLP